MNYLLHGIFEEVHWSAGKPELLWSPFKKAGFGKVWAAGRFNKKKSLLTLAKSICTKSSWWFEICDFQILHCPNSEISTLNWLFELSKFQNLLCPMFIQCKSSIFDLAIRFVISKELLSDLAFRNLWFIKQTCRSRK